MCNFWQHFLSQCILCVLCLFSTLSHGEDALQISIIIVTMRAYAQPAHTDKTFPYTPSLLLYSFLLIFLLHMSYDVCKQAEEQDDN